MGRHRSTLRDLGWAASNSPNPWKQGSAKRVVRALDYGNIDVDEQGAAADRPAAAAEQRGAAPGEDAAGISHLNRIREQFEAEEAENKCKLERLNGRIAELSDGKRALWSMLSVQQKQKQKPPERGADPTTVQGLASGVVGAESEGSLLAREEAVVRAEAALSKLKTAHAESVAMQEAQLARREEAVQQAEERIIAKEAIAAQRMASVARGEAELQAAKLALADLEAGVAAREEQLARAEAVLHKANSSRQEQEAHVFATKSAIADNQQQLAAAFANELPKYSAPDAADVGGKRPAPHVAPIKAIAPEVAAPAVASGSSAQAKPRPKLMMPWSGSKPPKPPAPAADKELVIDRGAEWARADNLALSLVQQSASADDIFCPLAQQQTCKLSDIFSEPRQRAREPGSGDWTPLSAAAGTTPIWQGSGTRMQLIGVEGEYAGETLTLPLHASDVGLIVIGRSSSCEVTLARDDQISRRHVEVQARDGKLFIRDLGSTYGTRLNGTAVGDEHVQVRPGDVVSVGTSSFRLQALVVLAASG